MKINPKAHSKQEGFGTSTESSVVSWNRPGRKSEFGHLLVTVVVITALISLALMWYLDIISNETRMVDRSQLWNACIPVAEAGVEEALTQMFNNYATNMTANGWTLINDEYVKTNTLALKDKPAGWTGDGWYSARISTNMPYVVTSTGYMPLPGGTTTLSRTIRVQTRERNAWDGPLLVKTFVDLNGNNVTSDSFDSRYPTMSTDGKYDPAKRRDHGDIGTAEGVIDSVSVGNANIFGHILTGARGSVTVGPNGSIGDMDWHNAGNMGIKPGWWINDYSADFPDAKAPFSSAPQPPANVNIGGVTYDYVLGDGNYMVNSLGGKVLVNGNATLLVTGDIKFTGGDRLELTAGISCNLYCAGSQAVFNNIANPNTYATNFCYYGLPSNTYLELMGVGSITAAIFAPSAALNIKGGADIYGGVIAASATLVGQGSFHFDEALKDEKPLRGFAVTSWDEL